MRLGLAALCWLILLVPATTSSGGSADAWLDRAERDIRAATQEEIEPDLNILNDAILGSHLVKLSGRNTHRTLLREIAARMERLSASEKNITRKLGYGWAAADSWSVAGDNGEAIRVLKGAATLLDEAEEAGNFRVFATDLTKSTHRQIRARCGDLTAQEIQGLSLQDLSSICQLLDASGDQELQGPFVEASRGKFNAIQKQDVTSFRLWCEILIYTGRGDEALIRAGEVPIEIRDDVLLTLVRKFQDRGETEWARRAAVGAWEAVKLSQGGNREMMLGSALGWLVEAAGPKDVIANAADLVAAPVRSLKGRRLFQERFAVQHLVKATHYLGRAAERDDWLAKLESVMPLESADRRGEEWVQLASLATEVDRLDLAERYLATARKERRSDYSWLYATTVVHEYARRGEFEKAEKLLAEIYPDRSDIDDVRLAKARVRLGQYDAAIAMATRMPKQSDRLRVKHAIVVHRVQNGKLDRLADWIDAEPSLRQRAALNLAAAEEVLNRRLDAYSLVLRIPK